MSNFAVQHVKTPAKIGTLGLGGMPATVGKSERAGPLAIAYSKATATMQTNNTTRTPAIAGRPATGHQHELT